MLGVGGIGIQDHLGSCSLGLWTLESGLWRDAEPDGDAPIGHRYQPSGLTTLLFERNDSFYKLLF